VNVRPRIFWYLICALSPHLSSRRLLWMYYELQSLRARRKAGQVGALEGLLHRVMSRRFPRYFLRYSALISEDTVIGPGAVLLHGFLAVRITKAAVIGARCTFAPNVSIAAHGKHAPVIGDDVFIGAGAVIVGRCRIGNGAQIGAGVTITNSVVPAGATIINKSAYNLTARSYLRTQK
jgi:serine acetyltransferase